MKVYETSDIRNVALVGHGHSGKTALTGALLFTSGATPRLTRPDEGNTITDFDDEEIARKITISSAVADKVSRFFRGLARKGAAPASA